MIGHLPPFTHQLLLPLFIPLRPLFTPRLLLFTPQSKLVILEEEEEVAAVYLVLLIMLPNLLETLFQMP